MTITAPATARYGFEAYSVYSTAGQCYCFAYTPNTGAWVFSGAAGVSENGTCLTSGNPPTPQMTRTAFLQTGGRMAITVTGLAVSETYRIGFVMARRGNYNAHLGRTFTLTMGGQNLGVYSPMTTTWEQALTAAVVANAASLQLVLEAGAEPGNDSMALIDDVAVMPAHPHAARAMGNGNSFGYDANGNMTVRREKLDGISSVYTQTWTIDNRLTSVVKSDVTGTILATTTISYDGDGARVKKSDPSGTTYYLGTVEVLIIGTTLLTTSYYAFGGAMVAMRTAATATLTYLHGDHLGSTSLTTNATGQKVSEQRYRPYGELRWSSGAGMPTDFTFTGQRAGPANYVGSLMDYNARFYSPALGRFASADTIVPGAANPAAFNRYMYVLGNPLGRVDPSGHCGAPCAVFIAALVVSLVGGAELAYIAGAPAVRNGSAPGPDTLDVTDWTLGRIGEALGSREMNDIRNNWAVGPHFLPAGVEALHDWVSMVRGGAQWDYKPELVGAFNQESLPNPSGRKLVVFFGEETSYQAVANFTYGFYGAHIGLPPALLVAGAGAFQKEKDGRGRPVDIRGADCYDLEGCRVVHAAVTLGDDPYDSWWVRVGYEAYMKFGADLSKVSRHDFQQWLDWYRSKQDPQPKEPINW